MQPPNRKKALDAALAQYKAGGSSLAIEPLQTYLAQHPQSPWRGALLANIGLMYEQQSYLGKALDYLGQARAAMGEPTTPAQQALLDAVLGRQLRLQAQFGNSSELKRLLASVGHRRLIGSADAEKAYAQSSLREIERTPEQVLRCGLVSLLEILKLERADEKALTKVSTMPAKQYGTSLADLSRIARQSGHAMTAIHLAPDEAIPVPSVMHLKAGHFVAIVAQDSDRYQVRDPAIGREHWVNREVIDSESSGYFLTPTKLTGASNERRWRLVASKEAKQIIGAGNTTQPMTPPPPCHRNSDSSGMPVASIDNPQTSLCLTDTPISYQPPKGPAVSFDLWYFQKNVSQPANRTFSNVGPMWSHNWLSYIQDNPNAPGNNVSIYSRDSGAWTYSGYNAGNGTFAREQTSRALLIQVSRNPITYERDFPDGSKEIYSQSDGATFAPRRIFLTQVIDKTGNAVTLSYDSQNRLATITDALGQQTTFQYGDANPLLITGVSDPFGRSVSLAYDNAGRLLSVTDAIGMTTSFTYDATFITSMTTPYGTSQFTSGQQGYRWWATATDPLGYTERVEFRHGAPGIPFSETRVPANTITPIYNAYINYRNTYFWDRAVMANLGGQLDYTKAQIKHWLHRYNDYTWNTPVPILESMKAPLENRVWYYYTGQPNSVMAGPSAQLGQIARVLDDGSTQSYRMTYNAQGNILTRTDPLGRTTYFDYSANGIDVVQIRQAAGNMQDVLAAYTYNNQHLPLTYTDAAGQTTTYNYNDAGQLTTVTDPDGNTTRYLYNSLGYLESIINANGKTQSSFTYDAIGRLASDTDSEGYTLSYQYDALNRKIRTTYPDGTYEQIAYDKLDVASRTNRLGQTTNYTYDAVRNLRTVTDPMGHVVRYDYDPAGRLISLTDANNQTTSWQRDIQGRVTRTIYADGTSERYAYDRAGRLIARTDALNQAKTITYTADNQLQSFIYANAVNPTPSVYFTYDALYPRVTAMQDGTGTTMYQYVPVGSLGALQLASEQGPRAHDTIQYTYDALSRLVRRTVDGLDETYTYDALGRVTGTANPLGQFTTSYLGETGQPTQTTIANVPYEVRYQYEDNLGDRRLKAILNDTTASGTPRPVMDYAFTTSPEDLILSRTENDGSAVARHGRRHHGWEVGRHEGWDHAPHWGVLAWLLGERDDDRHADRRGHRQADPGHRGHHRDHDAEDGTSGVSTQYIYDPDRRLLAATGGITRDYAYDPADNLTAITTPDATTAIGTNSVNAITTAGNRSYHYDANGNVLDDGQRTYAWDAENRLIRVTDTASGHVSAFAYDGRSHRLAVTETDPGATPVETRYLWCGETVCEARDGAEAVIARYYGQGELKNGQAYFYAQDQVGSVVALVDAAGHVAGRVGYDPYGNVLSSTGTLPDYRYAGLYGHDSSGLFLATYRAYDPAVGRWLNRDPIGLAGGLNLYAYVAANPLRWIDPTGFTAMTFSPSTGVLTVDPEVPGRQPYSVPATSGVPNCGCDEKTRDKGPIPRGNYTMHKKDLTNPGPVGDVLRNLRGDWGDWRVPLTPDPGTSTHGRDGFFMHGGRWPGSAGCIDIGGGLTGNAVSDQILNDILRDPDGKIPVIVK